MIEEFLKEKQPEPAVNKPDDDKGDFETESEKTDETGEKAKFSYADENVDDGFPGKITRAEKGFLVLLEGHKPDKLALYRDLLGAVREHSKVTETAARFLNGTSLITEQLQPLWDTIIGKIKEGRYEEFSKGGARSAIGSEIKKLEKVHGAAVVKPNDPRNSPEMRLSYKAQTKGYHHKRIGHT